MKKKNIYELSDDIVNYTVDLYNGTPIVGDESFTTVFTAHSYSAFCMGLLSKCTVTTDIAMLMAKNYLVNKDNFVASVMLLNNRNKLKDIEDFARDYRPLFSGFADEIEFLCNCQKCKKCIIIYNYDTNGSLYEEIYDIDKLYGNLKSMGITLVDAIKVVNGKATPIISPFK